MRRPLKFLLFALLPVLAFVGCDSDTDGDDLLDLDDLIENRSNLDVLQAALQETGLNEDLDDDDNTFTVFAPTDDAFEALLAATGLSQEELLDYEDLESLLLFHVSTSILTASDLEAGDEIATAFGANTFTIVEVNGGLGIDADADGEADARITTTDLEAINGVVHLIDAVLLPDALEVPGDDSRTFEISFSALNESGVTATGSFTLSDEDDLFSDEDDAFLAMIEASGLDDVMHAQHIHAGTECPTLEAHDTNDDGFISLAEGVPAYGGVIVSLDDVLGDNNVNTYPMGTEIDYEESADLDDFLDAYSAFDSVEELDLESRIVILHGVAELPAGAMEADAATFPVACGTISEVDGEED
ncbi:MAG: fasciclin domain-containing protein [Rhodothermales bacterium]|nr:fasciclin domain-containing protein [Rhodothermales bacterium]